MTVISPAAVWASAGDAATHHAHATTTQIESDPPRVIRFVPATRFPPGWIVVCHARPDPAARDPGRRTVRALPNQRKL